jgi:hypothetical protein
MKHDVYDQDSSTGINRDPGSGSSKSNSPKTGSDQEQMMKKMEAAGTPGTQHKALGALVGDWKAEVRCWMDPGQPPKLSQAQSSVKWTLDGRFVEEEFHGKRMGEDFTGHCLLGFDNIRQKFNSVWVDDKHTSMFTSEGRGDTGNKTITLEGKMDCPASGQRDVPMKQIFHLLSPEKHVLEMFNDGKRTMEITYTRP